MRKVLVLGSSGQLGRELSDLLNEQKIEFEAPSSKEVDVTDQNGVMKYFKDHQPEVVFDCVGYTNIAGAEEEPGKTINQNVNFLGTQYVALAARDVDATLVHISTNRVFDGNDNSKPHKTTDIPTPISEYGKQKRMAERAIEEISTKYYTIRTANLFGKDGSKLVSKLLESTEDDEIKLNNTQSIQVTSTSTLAKFMLLVIQNDLPYGMYHLTNEEIITPYEFVKRILRNKDLKITGANYRYNIYNVLLDLNNNYFLNK
ncbi:SDR family oxidoreductase [Fructilactobacillus fructivorans]|uniref:dTDP-4-dehydrorhamnose reductase n=1 Tax=Fructilactobacillus fructivorans TaxID=1614 RepID=A0A0C1PQY3_9LACO|nr:NAD(P)-dependent oxidoreductase [Fructilactobacillus fructivorans]KID42286.1 dTDP-4-dehydrorhamnose reductase [Fructilactobacillus fructivorans]MCT0151094.1 NAD(P)-dependent oxidoreductase [Fructilactobacillus fructivorans]MCT2867348.1 NAD(P)-dependent oxidoreductase [Fructilactobacillus fructivorans]MCT2869133.1 NAD(P)-dependent oxidoreductase [Fructilactobacillus fructivorans]MCT2873147.1 NAD(P)-dependent oxidoreductase [Fructilactobacillus fructivorans]